MTSNRHAVKTGEATAQQPYPFQRGFPREKQALIVTRQHSIPKVVVGRIASQRSGRLIEGLGVNLPPAFQPGQEKVFPRNARDWRKLAVHLDWLGVNWIRYWLIGEAIIPRPGVFRPRHRYLDRLLRLHDWARKAKANLIVDYAIVPSWCRFPVPKSQDSVTSAPADIEQYVDAFALPLAKHIVCDLKLERVKYLCLFNEPFNPDYPGSTFYVPRGIDIFAHYVQLHACLRKRLDAEGISRDRLGLIGPNSHDLFVQPLEEFRKRKVDLIPHLAAVDEHCYRIRLDYLPPAEHIPTLTISETLSRYLKPALRHARRRQRPYFITEYSTFYYGGISGDPLGPARHEAFLTEAEFIIRSLAAGVAGGMKWSFLNSGQADGKWQYIETLDGSYQPIPNTYYGNAVLSRYLPRGGDIHPIHWQGSRRSFIHGLAARYPGGACTILLVNDHPGETIEVSVGPVRRAAWHAWTTDTIRKHERTNVCVQQDRLSLVLAPMSITALTTFPLGEQEPGLIDLGV
jgi:hypothetical protein